MISNLLEIFNMHFLNDIYALYRIINKSIDCPVLLKPIYFHWFFWKSQLFKYLFDLYIYNIIKLQNVNISWLQFRLCWWPFGLWAMKCSYYYYLNHSMVQIYFLQNIDFYEFANISKKKIIFRPILLTKHQIHQR